MYFIFESRYQNIFVHIWENGWDQRIGFTHCVLITDLRALAPELILLLAGSSSELLAQLNVLKPNNARAYWHEYIQQNVKMVHLVHHQGIYL